MVLVYIAMTVLLLVLGFTQVYAKEHAFVWTGFGTFLLIAPIISFAMYGSSSRSTGCRLRKSAWTGRIFSQLGQI